MNNFIEGKYINLRDVELSDAEFIVNIRTDAKKTRFLHPTSGDVQQQVEYLKKYNLYEFKDKYPSQLSGGMRQRAALIRTLATSPEILLLDEAFSALDYQTRLSVTDDVYKIIKQEGKTTIMVTHDIPESISMSDKVIVLSKRPAIIKKVYDIDFQMDGRTPLNCRENPKFSKFFDCIWRELNT